MAVRRSSSIQPKARVNLAKHKVSFAHAEQALRDPSAVTIEDPDAQDARRFVTLGMDALGRILVVLTRRAATASG